MIGTFDDYLGPVAASVSPTLISASSFSDINSVARVLPGTLAYNTFGFECRLGEENPRADFLVHARASQGRDSLAGLHPASVLPNYLMDDPIWQRVQDFGARWVDPASPLHGAVDNVWLEFDIDGPASAIPVPSVFFGLPANGAQGEEGEVSEQALEGARRTTVSALRLLSGAELPPPVLDTLTGCFGALSPPSTSSRSAS